jgi:hypothetical protein
MKAVSTKMDYQVSFNPVVAGSYIIKRHSGRIWIDEGAIQNLLWNSNLFYNLSWQQYLI